MDRCHDALAAYDRTLVLAPCDETTAALKKRALEAVARIKELREFEQQFEREFKRRGCMEMPEALEGFRPWRCGPAISPTDTEGRKPGA
jgi:hypothetical protein